MKVVKQITALAIVGGALLGVSGPVHAGFDDLPDLVVRSADLHPTGACSSLEPSIVGDVIIKNVGQGRAKALVLTPLVTVYDDKRRSFKDADIKINSLAPGETTKARVRIGSLREKSGYKGWRKFVVKVDPKNRIRETNERNNTFVVKLPVHCK